jgi:hypoxanthine phosphoribosyltransferase
VAERVLFSASEIRTRVAELAVEIARDVPEGRIILLGVLKGAIHFASDLARELGPRVEIDFIQPSSYGASTKSTGIVQLKKDHDLSIAGRHVVIVEDIVDTGLTLAYLREFLETRQPASLRAAALLSKPSARQISVEVEYIGFDIPNEFVVGYGLDLDESYRGLPYIAVIDGVA